MKTFILTLFYVMCLISTRGQINSSIKPIENKLESHQSPNMGMLYELAKHAQSAQLAKVNAEINSFLEYYKAFNFFKKADDGKYTVTLIVDNYTKQEASVDVRNNMVVSVELNKVYTTSNGLKVPTEINNAYSKVFLDLNGNLVAMNLYFTSLFSSKAQ